MCASTSLGAKRGPLLWCSSCRAPPHGYTVPRPHAHPAPIPTPSSSDHALETRASEALAPVAPGSLAEPVRLPPSTHGWANLCVCLLRGDGHLQVAWTHLDVQSGMSTHPHAKQVVWDRQIEGCEEKAGGLCARSAHLCCYILLWNSDFKIKI